MKSLHAISRKATHLTASVAVVAATRAGAVTAGLELRIYRQSLRFGGYEADAPRGGCDCHRARESRSHGGGPPAGILINDFVNNGHPGWTHIATGVTVAAATRAGAVATSLEL